MDTNSEKNVVPAVPKAAKPAPRAPSPEPSGESAPAGVSPDSDMIRLKSKITTTHEYTLASTEPGEKNVVIFRLDGHAVSERFDRLRLTDYTKGLIDNGYFIVIK